MSKIGSMAWKTMVGLLIAGCVATLAEGREVADLVLTGGKVMTVDETRPRAEAVAIRGDRIEAVGSVEEIARYTGPGTRVIELAGKLVLPGFIEGHGHFLGLGQSKMMLDASLAATWENLVHQLPRAVPDPRAGRAQLHAGRCLRRLRGRDQGLPDPRQTGRPRGPVPRYPIDNRTRHPGRPRGLHDRGRARGLRWGRGLPTGQ